MSRLELPPRVCLWAAFALLVFPLRWLLAWLLAAAVHEGFHILAIFACGGKIRGMRIGLGGAVIEIAPMSPGRELICALAGPGGGLLLLSVARWMPLTALWGLIQSVWNLLPVYPLDGGRILRCLLRITLGEERGESMSRVLSAGFSLAVTGAAVYGWLCRGWGIFPLLGALSLMKGRE